MPDRIERRTCVRRNYQVPVEVSYVRDKNRVPAQSLNHSQAGMCFEGSCAFHPGVTLYVKVSEFHPCGPCVGLCEGLRYNTLAEVKWCRELPDTEVPRYRVGIQFFATVY